MILTAEEAEKRLNSPDNLATKFGEPKVIPLKQPGRKEDVPNIPVQKREAIAVKARIGTKQRELAAEFKTTQAHVSQLERGIDKSIDSERVNDEVSLARDEALQKLLVSMKLITPKKLERLKAVELGAMAARMSTVVKNLTPEEKAQNTVQVVVYAPELRKEENFKTLEV